MNKFITRKNISLALGIMVLLSLPVAVFLTRQQQDIRQRASSANCVREAGKINAYPAPGSCTLQDAYSLAQSGDVILLNSGTYTLPDDFSIEKSITLRGVSPWEAIITGTEGNPISLYLSPSITGSYSITIERLTIGPWAQISAGTTPDIPVTANIFDNKIIGRESSTGTFLQSLLSISNGVNATITGNTFSGTGIAAVIIDPISAPSTPTVFHNNTIDGEFENGIWIFEEAKVDIQYNKIDVKKTAGFGRGINLGGSSVSTIKNNSITNNGLGIAAFDTPTIQNIATFPDGNGFSNNTENCKSFTNTVFAVDEPTTKTKCPDGTGGGPQVTPIPTASPTPTGTMNPSPTPTGSVSSTPTPTPTAIPNRYNPKADLNDNGTIDGADLNILYGGFETRKGD